MTREPMSILLFEPEAWRYSGISRFLTENGVQVVAGSLAGGHDGDAPDAVMLAHTLVNQCGSEIVERIRSAYPLIGILVHGETECVTTTASLLALGVQGYFVLSTPQPRLLDALRVVADRGFWAPRAALALLAQRASEVPARGDAEDEDRIVLALLLEGLSNKEIAARLGVAEVTVKARLTRLYKRHGVRTRLQLLSSAIRQHLIETGI